VITRTGKTWDLPVLAHEDSVHALVLRPRGVRRTARANAARDVAFRLRLRRRHPEALISRLNSLACTCPFQRFADALTSIHAWFGVIVDR
jgi:hypothetical protein